MQIESAKELDVYKLANEFAMEIFEITKNFSSRRKTRFDESDTALVEIGLLEPSRSMGKEALRSPFCE
jgi:hypothetical protein